MSDMMADLEGMMGGPEGEQPEAEQPTTEGVYENEEGQAAVFVSELNEEVTLEKFKDLSGDKQGPVFNAVFGRQPKGDSISKKERIAVEIALEEVPVWQPAGPAPEGLDTTPDFDEGMF